MSIDEEISKIPFNIVPSVYYQDDCVEALKALFAHQSRYVLALSPAYINNKFLRLRSNKKDLEKVNEDKDASVIGMVTPLDFINRLETLEERTKGIKAIDVLSIRRKLPENENSLMKEIFTIGHDRKVVEAIRMMTRYHTGPVVVQENGKTIGIFTEVY